MAQFDFYTFSVQIFWITISFFSLYFIFLHFYLTNLSAVLKARTKLEFFPKLKTVLFSKKNW